MPLPDSRKVYYARLISQIPLEKVKEVTPLATHEKQSGIYFVARTKDDLFVFRCGTYNR